MEIITWAIGILVTVQLAVTGFLATRLWGHVAQCGTERRHVDARMSAIEGDLERAKIDIGTHDSGIRGHVHQIGQMVYAHELKIANIERAK